MHLEIYVHKCKNPRHNGEVGPDRNFSTWEKFTEVDFFVNSDLCKTPSDLERALYVSTSDYCGLCSRSSPDPVDDELMHMGDCKDCWTIDQSSNYNGDVHCQNYYIVGKKNRRVVVFVWNHVPVESFSASTRESFEKEAQSILDRIPDTCFDIKEEFENLEYYY